jgi:hypothetical protein
MKSTVTYVGPLAEGLVQCPATCRNYAFKKGEPFDLPENLAVNIAAQSPNDWSVSAVVKKLADEKSSIVVIAPAISESDDSDETTDEKVSP